jgi:dTMP kinase
VKWPQKGRSVTQTGAPLGRFVVFEGIDGAGTTTQTRLLVERMRTAGVRVWQTSEPTSRPVGELARRVLAGDVRVPPATIAHIFAGDRADHIWGEDGILEHLEAGEIVVCDRYKYSSLAYQSLDAGAELVSVLNAPFPDPELLVFVDLPYEVGEERLARRSRRDIYENVSFQERVRTRYLEIIGAVPKSVSVVVVDGTLPVAEIAQKIWDAVEGASILRV